VPESEVDLYFDTLIESVAGSAETLRGYLAFVSPVFRGHLRDSWRVGVDEETIFVEGLGYFEDLNEGFPAGRTFTLKDFEGLRDWFEEKLGLPDGAGAASKTLSKWRRFGREPKYLIDLSPTGEAAEILTRWMI
jgi:hypothetical protein